MGMKPIREQQAEAWFKVAAALDSVQPGWLEPFSDKSAAECAVECIQSMHARITELEKDAARLDWIDKVGEVHICRVREGSVSGNLRWDVEYGYYGDLAQSKKGMRKAIDAAMQKD